MSTYHGSCHCGAIRFSFDGEEILEALSCNCSICNRRGAAMSPYRIPGDRLQREVSGDALGCYEFGKHLAKHHFCRICGIYPFHETMVQPGYFRVNLGCVEGLDAFALPRTVYNGRELL